MLYVQGAEPKPSPFIRVGGGLVEGNNVNEVRKQYFATLGLSPTQQVKDAPSESPPEQQVKVALARAYELRTFEIEHYWKRATYFWGFQIAIFAAFGFIWRDTSAATFTEWHPVAFALTGLGVLTALANSLSARGSRFWQQNWERHIDMLEDKIEGRLYKTVWLDEGKVSFSVSRVNQALSNYFIGFWVIVAAYVAWKSLGAVSLGWVTSAGTYVTILTIIIVICAAGLWGQTTDLSRATLPKADGSHGDPVRQDYPKPAEPEPASLI